MESKIRTFTSLAYLVLVSCLISCEAGIKNSNQGYIKHSPKKVKGKNYFNQSPQILVLNQNDVLPNKSKLRNSRIIVSAYGGSAENNTDQRVYLYTSEDNGSNFSQPKLLNSGIEDQKGIYYNGSLFKLSNNRVVQFYLRAQDKAGSEMGLAPINLRYKYSDNGGEAWSDFTEPNIKGITFRDSIKLCGPISNPIVINDTLNFPLYYRYVGKRNTYFGILRCTQTLGYFELNKFEHITLVPPNIMIEPSMISLNDTLHTYFRTSLGYVGKIISINGGKTWSQPILIGLMNPSSPINVFAYNNKIYTIANVSSEKRDNLSILSSDDGTKFELCCVVEKGDEKTSASFAYPSSFTLGSQLYMAYSCIYPDIKVGALAGDIKVRILPSTMWEKSNSAPVSVRDAQVSNNFTNYICAFLSMDSIKLLLDRNGQLSINKTTIQLKPAYGFESMYKNSNGILAISGPYGVAISNNIGKSWKAIYTVEQEVEDGYQILECNKDEVIIQSFNKIYHLDYEGNITQKFALTSRNQRLGAFDYFFNKPVKILNQSIDFDSYLVITTGGNIWRIQKTEHPKILANTSIQGVTTASSDANYIYIGTESGNVYALNNKFTKHLVFQNKSQLNMPIRKITIRNGKLLILTSEALVMMNQGSSYLETIFTLPDKISNELIDFSWTKSIIELVSRIGKTYTIKSV